MGRRLSYFTFSADIWGPIVVSSIPIAAMSGNGQDFGQSNDDGHGSNNGNCSSDRSSGRDSDSSSCSDEPPPLIDSSSSDDELPPRIFGGSSSHEDPRGRLSSEERLRRNIRITRQYLHFYGEDRMSCMSPWADSTVRILAMLRGTTLPPQELAGGVEPNPDWEPDPEKPEDNQHVEEAVEPEAEPVDEDASKFEEVD